MLFFKDHRILQVLAVAAWLVTVSAACTLITDTHPMPMDAVADPEPDPDDEDVEEEEAPQVYECSTSPCECPMDATCECDGALCRVVCLGDCDVRMSGAGGSITCASGADCTGDCAASGCTMTCGAGGSCFLECSATDCTLVCAAGADCTVDCQVIISQCHCLGC